MFRSILSSFVTLLELFASLSGIQSLPRNCEAAINYDRFDDKCLRVVRYATFGFVMRYAGSCRPRNPYRPNPGFHSRLPSTTVSSDYRLELVSRRLHSGIRVRIDDHAPPGFETSLTFLAGKFDIIAPLVPAVRTEILSE